MGEIRTKVKLANAVDTALVSMGKLPADDVRRMEVDACVDSAAVFSRIPLKVMLELGLPLRAKQIVDGNGDDDVVNATGPIVFGIESRQTVEEALVLGHEVVIGCTVMSKLNLHADHSRNCIVPDPDDVIRV